MKIKKFEENIITEKFRDVTETHMLRKDQISYVTDQDIQEWKETGFKIFYVDSLSAKVTEHNSTDKINLMKLSNNIHKVYPFIFIVKSFNETYKKLIENVITIKNSYDLKVEALAKHAYGNFMNSQKDNENI